MKEFVASTEPLLNKAGEALRPIPFKFQGVQFTVEPPGEAELAYLVATNASNREDADRISAIIDFFDNALPARQRPQFRKLLFAAKRDGFTVVTNIFESCLEEWTGRPTGSASD